MNAHNAAQLHGLHCPDGAGFGIAGAWGVKVFYSDQFVLPLPVGHRFPMKKYSMLRERVAAAGICGPGEMRVPEPVTDAEVLTAHEPGYLEKVVAGSLTAKEVRRIGFPWSRRMVERSRRASGGTLGACHAALEEGVAANLAGGTHHAFADRGEGFCVLNDSAIASRVLLEERLVGRVVVVDTDVHQGNGTAAIRIFPSTRRRATSTCRSPTGQTTGNTCPRSKAHLNASSISKAGTSPSSSLAPTRSRATSSAGSR